MAKRKNPPTPEDIGKIVAERLPADKPLFIHEFSIITAIRYMHNTTTPKAREWLLEAVSSGTVIMVQAHNNGRFLSQYKRDTNEESPYPFTLDSVEYASEEVALANHGWLDATGEVHMSEQLPEGSKGAPSDSDWVTVPSSFALYLEAANAFLEAQRVAALAYRAADKAAIIAQCGDDLGYLAGLLQAAGIELNWMTPTATHKRDKIHASFHIRDGATIHRVATILKEAGIKPTEEWKKYL